MYLNVRYLRYLTDILQYLSYTQICIPPSIHSVVFVTINVTFVTLYPLKSPFTAFQTGPINVMTLFVIDTLTTLLPAVLPKRIAITRCRKFKKRIT